MVMFYQRFSNVYDNVSFSYKWREDKILEDVSLSIEDNIKIGNIEAKRKQVIEAAKKASIHEFI